MDEKIPDLSAMTEQHLAELCDLFCPTSEAHPRRLKDLVVGWREIGYRRAGHLFRYNGMTLSAKEWEQFDRNCILIGLNGALRALDFTIKEIIGEVEAKIEEPLPDTLFGYPVIYEDEEDDDIDPNAGEEWKQGTQPEDE
jgi:hypothetical protein